MRLLASMAYSSLASMPMRPRPSLFATAPVVPVPKNGSSTTSPGLVEAMMTRWSSPSGFCVGCALAPFCLSRSWPVHSGMSQSLRICKSSLSAFMAS